MTTTPLLKSEDDPESGDGGYGATASSGGGSGQRRRSTTIEEIESAQGPFGVNLKSMLIAEFAGTCFFVELGCAANAISLYLYHNTKGPTWQVAIIWGLSLMIAIYTTAALSGGHLNPAVSFSFSLVRPTDFPFRRLIPYWAAQLLGAMLAGAINLFLFHASIRHYEKKAGFYHRKRGYVFYGDTNTTMSADTVFGNYWSEHPHHTSNSVHAFAVEAFGAAVLVFVMFVITHRRNPIPGLLVPGLVGLTYACLIGSIGVLTGGSFNPARDFGPRLVSVMGHWGPVAMMDFLPYLLGPLIGAPIGGWIADKIFMN